VVFDISCYRPIWHRDGLGRQTDFVYNTLGQLALRTDPADADLVRNKTIITWDATTGVSRMAAVQVCGDTAQLCNTPDEIKTTYTYWGNTLLPATVNQIDAARGETLTTTNTYHPSGRLWVEDRPMAGTNDASYFLYDKYGRQEWSIGPVDVNAERQAKYTSYRDSDDKASSVDVGSVTSVTTPVLTPLMRTETSYDARRNPTVEKVLASGSTYTLTQRTFDDRGRLTCEARRMNPNEFADTALPADACTLETTVGPFGQQRQPAAAGAASVWHVSPAELRHLHLLLERQAEDREGRQREPHDLRVRRSGPHVQDDLPLGDAGGGGVERRGLRAVRLRRHWQPHLAAQARRQDDHLRSRQSKPSTTRRTAWSARAARRRPR
jgi:YD repeat-containing protein